MKRLNTIDRDTQIILGMSILNLIIHLLTNGQYGFHRDELYFIDCAKHLDYGYADMPPLTPLIAKITISLFGETLRGLRFFPTITSSVMVFLTGQMAKEMGGKLYAQILASLAFIVAPIFLVAGTQFQTIIVNQIFWVLTCYLIIKLINTNNQKLWLIIGLVLGLGLLAKYSVAFLAFAIFVGFLVSRHKNIFTEKWVWLGVLVAFLAFLPNILWQIYNDFPVFDHMHALHEDESAATSQFLIDQILILHPLNFPIWIAGLIFYLFNKQGKKYQVFMWIYFIALFIFLLMKGKSYYLAPAYPVLFAGGSVLIENWLIQKKLNYIRYAFPSLILVSSIILSPLWLPILSIEKIKKLGIDDFRYDYREMIGWPELVKSVSEVYNNLSKEDQINSIIITGNYGEAGSINHFGAEIGLPPACSGISSYHAWGPINPKATVFLFVGYSENYLRTLFSEVALMKTFKNKYEINNEEQGQHIILCRNPNTLMPGLWNEFKHY